MKASSRLCADGEEFSFLDAGQEWIVSWHPPIAMPSGTPHGSASICFTLDRKIVLVSTTHGESWEFPGGRPEGNENWYDTLEREITEEACAQLTEASLLGYSVGRCIRGHEASLVIVRALCRSVVQLMPWDPKHETTDRCLVESDVALDKIRIPQGMRPIYERWLHEAGV